MKRSLLALAAACTLLAVTASIPQRQCSTEDLVDQVMPACVAISVMIEVDVDGITRRGLVGGSGVYISDKGYILTCAHLFNQEGWKILSITVENYNGDMIAGSLLKIDDSNDLALVKTDFFKKTPFVKLADPRKLKIGQEVIAVGGPLSLLFSVSKGIISQLNRDFPKAYNMLQSDVAVNPGNSGGPVFNVKGELVGIVSFLVSPVDEHAIFTGIGFHVSSGQCLEFLTRCKKDYKELKETSWLGILSELMIMQIIL